MNWIEIIIGAIFFIGFFLWIVYEVKKAVEYPEDFEDRK